jgi:drug/metabolite transporter (DMT)-like permease
MLRLRTLRLPRDPLSGLRTLRLPHGPLSGLGIPIVFVLIWSTGFIVAKAVAPHADLQLYLVARLSLTALLMGAAGALAGAKWPTGRGVWPHLLAGALMQGVYLCASYWAIARGLAAGVMSLLGALQPLFTALFLVAVLGRRLASRTWIGLVVGFAGVSFVLVPKLLHTGVGSLAPLTVVAALASVMAVTAGALVQKWLAATDLRTAASVQNFGGACVAVLVTWAAGTGQWDGSALLWGALAWAVLVPSVVGTTLLMWMMRHGEATKVTALLLLVPPLAAVQAYLLFHETLSQVQLVGFALALFGVLLTRTAPKQL